MMEPAATWWMGTRPGFGAGLGVEGGGGPGPPVQQGGQGGIGDGMLVPEEWGIYYSPSRSGRLVDGRGSRLVDCDTSSTDRVARFIRHNAR